MATTRKRSDRNAVDEERPALRRGATAEVTDEKVEEFFAILRKMRNAAKSFAAKGGGGEKKGKEEEEQKGQPASRWRPEFVLEDFAVAGFVEDAGRRKKQISMAAAAESSKGRSSSREAAMGEDEEESVAENGNPWGFLDLNADPAFEE